MTIPLFGWKDHGPPDIDAANLEAMNAAAGAYTDALAAEKGAASGLASLDGEEHLTASQVPPSVANSSGTDALGRTHVLTSSSIPVPSLPNIVSVMDAPWSAPGNTKRVEDGVIAAGSKELHSATAAFTEADEGKTIEVAGAGSSSAVPLATTIASVAGGVATLAAAATTEVASGAIVTWGTPDTTAFQKAHEAVSAHGPGVLVVPAGYAYYMGVVKAKSHTTIMAYGATIYLRQGETNCGFQATTEVVSNWSLYGAIMPSDGITSGSGTRAAVFFSYVGSHGIRIRDCEVSGNKDSAVYIQDAYDVWVDDNTVINCCKATGRNSINIYLSTANVGAGHDIHVCGNNVRGFPTMGITIGTSSTVSTASPNLRVTVCDNNVVSEEACGSGIRAEGGAGGPGPGGSQLIMSNNTVTVTANTEGAMQLSQAAKCGPWKMVTMAANSIHSGGSGTGISLEGTSELSVTGNTVHAVAHAGILTTAFGYSPTVTLTENSTSVTSVSFTHAEEAEAAANGNHVKGTGIAKGTYLVAGAGTATWTLSAEATASRTGTIEVVTAVSGASITGNTVSLALNSSAIGMNLGKLSHSTVTGNTVAWPEGSTSGSGCGLFLEYSYHVKVDGGRYDYAPTYGAYLSECHDVELKGMTIYNANQVAAGICVEIRYSSGCEVDDCRLKDDLGSSHMTYAINASATPVSGLRATNNKIIGATNATPINPRANFAELAGNSTEAGVNEPAIITATNATYPIPHGAKAALITATGGGGGGGQAGTAAATQLQVGGAGGAPGQTQSQLVALGANTSLNVKVGAGGAGGEAGGEAGGKLGSNGAFGEATMVAGTGISVGGRRGGFGQGSAASSTTAVNAIAVGTQSESYTSNAPVAGDGGPSGHAGGEPLAGIGGGGGGGSTATTEKGGTGGKAGTAVVGGAQGWGAQATSAGSAGEDAAANTGAGGGGGGGGAAGTGAGGKGGKGGSGLVTIVWFA
jgi:hypothetical protein